MGGLFTPPLRVYSALGGVIVTEHLTEFCCLSFPPAVTESKEWDKLNGSEKYCHGNQCHSPTLKEKVAQVGSF